MEGTLATIVEMLGKMSIKEEGGGGSTADGTMAHLMQIPSRDAYSFGLQLLDIFFTKDELSSSLLFKSKKSHWITRKWRSFSLVFVRDMVISGT